VLTEDVDVEVALFFTERLKWYTQFQNLTLLQIITGNNNNNTNNASDNLYSVVIIAELLREFTWFTQ